MTSRNHHIILATVLAVLLGAEPSRASAQSLPLKHAPRPTTAGITVEDLMTREYIIADDSMQGRDTGRPGGLRAATYIANELKALGLAPAGDRGTYLQEIPWVRRGPDTTSTLRIGDALLRWGTDYLPLQRLGAQIFIAGGVFGSPFAGDNVESIYGGTLGDSAIISPEVARGKVVVFSAPVAMRGRPVWQRISLIRYADARAVVIASLGPDTYPAMREMREIYWDSLAPGPRAVSLIAVSPEIVRRIFSSDTPVMGAAGLPISGRVSFKAEPAPSPTYNVVGIVRGSNARLRNTYVAVGAHHDHVGMAPSAVDHDSLRAFNTLLRPMGADQPPPRDVTAEQHQRVKVLTDSLRLAHGGARRDSIFNGADDDGSGTVLGLELAEALTKGQRPERSVLFVFHAAEEKGLYGAQYYSDHPTVPRDSMVALINMDQMGRGDPPDSSASGPNALVVLGVRRMSRQLGAIAESVNARPEYGFRFDMSFDEPGHPSQGWCRSDHYYYARYGVPVLFFVSDIWYQDYHMVSDEPQYVEYPRLAKVGQYILDVVRSVAKLPARPVLDQPKMNPYGDCRQ
ncbi:MAG: M28 family peptidase [Gemmatimonadaceae bacterium]